MTAARRTVLIPANNWEPYSQLKVGVMRYARERANWQVQALPESLPAIFPGLAQWQGHGALLTVRTAEHLRWTRGLPFPVVNVSSFLPDNHLPRVRPDDAAVGRLAAEHLLSLGLQRFVFYGAPGTLHVSLREQGFRQRLAAAGFTCHSYLAKMQCATWDDWQQLNRGLDQVLSPIPRPFGVLGSSDALAHQVLDACLRLGFSVPAEVAVMGIDNVEPICRYADPPLTSIDRNMEQVGFEAARLLDRLMAGEKPPAEDVIIAPRGLSKRRSTDTIGVSDPQLRTVIEFMRNHVHEVFGVERLVPLVTVSRRGLERHFREQLGCTIHDYLSRLRVECGMELIAHGDPTTQKELAARCGFSSAKRFALVFRRITGKSAEEYRQSLRIA